MISIVLLAGSSSRGQENLDLDKVSPGLLGFFVMFFLALATFFLVRSMVWHLRKVRYSPEPGEQDEHGETGQPGHPGRKPGGAAVPAPTSDGSADSDRRTP
jgi:hypothetical protein